MKKEQLIMETVKDVFLILLACIIIVGIFTLAYKANVATRSRECREFSILAGADDWSYSFIKMCYLRFDDDWIKLSTYLEWAALPNCSPAPSIGGPQ